LGCLAAFAGADQLARHGNDGLAHEGHFYFGDIMVELIAYITFGQLVLAADACGDNVFAFVKGQTWAIFIVNAVTQGLIWFWVSESPNLSNYFSWL